MANAFIEVTNMKQSMNGLYDSFKEWEQFCEQLKRIVDYNSQDPVLQSLLAYVDSQQKNAFFANSVVKNISLTEQQLSQVTTADSFESDINSLISETQSTGNEIDGLLNGIKL